MTSENALTLESLLAGLQSQEQAAIEKTASVEKAKDSSPVTERLAKAFTKTASETQTTGDPSPMKNTDIGNAIAKQILTKLAEEGVNAVQTQTSAMVAQQDLSSAPTPVAGNVTEVAKALLARGAANGGVRDGALEENAVGAADQTQVQLPLMTSDGSMIDEIPSDLSEEAYEDQVEKVAAVATLIDAGVDFDDAVLLVKQAEEALAKEEIEQIKLASINSLMSEGVDVTSAVLATEQAIELMSKEAAEVTNSEAWRATGRQVGRGYAETLAGGIGGGAVGAGLGALAALASRGKIHMAQGATTGGLVGGLAGQYAGAIHGPYKSLKNTMEKERGGAVSTGEAVKAEARKQGRGLAEGLAGMAGGGAAGAGLGALAALASRGMITPSQGAMVGGGVGSLAGTIAGSLHGMKASTKNTMQAERDLAKTAAALEGLVEAGHTVEDALALLGIQ